MNLRTIKYLRKKQFSRKYTPSHEYTIPGLQEKLDAAFFLSEFKPDGNIDEAAMANWANKNWGEYGSFAAREGSLDFIPSPDAVPLYIYNNSIKARRRSWLTYGYKRVVKPSITVHWIPIDGVDNNQGENDERSVAENPSSE